jgi:DNA polymerase III subunit gamma/tau
MSYLVLARKWRPMTFDDLVGQEHVSRTISNAITTGRVAHAFLFTGVRGVGKTTSARILAKALNCEKGPVPKPCLQCPACVEIAAGCDIDVQEIDGASYNGIDEVRRLQESLPYRPSRDRFKIVIVDEVHMLSQSAWNAFLKTLEEPPPHVKFIFATTEAHKVPVTILSRCQRYDFKLISAQVIARRLRYVLEQENISADDAVVALLAREAAGSMRDGMSLLDQAIAWGGDKLVGEQIAQVLGVAGQETLQQLGAALVRGDAAACINTVEQLSNQGLDLLHAARNMLQVLRDLVVVKICKEPQRLTEGTAEDLRAIHDIGSEADLDDLLRLHLGFSNGFDQVMQSPHPRAALEMLLVRLARRPPLLPVDELVSRLLQLEKRLHGAAASAPAARGAKPRAVRDPLQSAPEHEESMPMHSLPQPKRAATPLPLTAPSRTGAQAESSAPLTHSPAETAQPPSQLSAEAIADWRAVLADVQQQNVSLGSILEHAVPLEISQEAVRLGFEQGSFYETQIRDEGALDLLTRIVRSHFAHPTAVSFTLQAASSLPGATVYEIDQAERAARIQTERKQLESHPLVQAVVKQLGARVTDVKLAGSGG